VAGSNITRLVCENQGGSGGIDVAGALARGNQGMKKTKDRMPLDTIRENGDKFMQLHRSK